jgi:superfamily II DNA or RNA helicase
VIQLRDYQKEAIDIIMQCKNKGLIVLPTGSGKTIIFSKNI